jgi:hypothetical protein
MNTTIEATQTNETQAPEPIRVIRKVNGRYQWVTLNSVDELTEDECRQIYCAAFGIYA